MRQAIEEGFILDVLQNYTTYHAYYQLEKTIEDDPAFVGKKAQSRVARFATLHPTALDQKVEVIVEHFRRHVAGELNGQAKAMVVTQGIEHAIRYWTHINRYIEKKGYDDLKALVAFSGEKTVDGDVWTEAQANGFAETELPKKFDTDAYQLLVVAEKYQTGFDQPKLVAMYVDKKLSGLQAVQTLARLNRTHPLKTKTFILDFQNTMDDIREAFAPYFETTGLEERTDPNQIYDLESRISGSTYIVKDEVERFAERFYLGDHSPQSRLQLEGMVRAAVSRFELDEDEAQQEEFRQLLRSFMRFYAFVAQILRLNDTWLEKLYVYASWLSRLLPSRDVPAEISLDDDMLQLSAFRLNKEEEGSASMQAGDTAVLPPITEFGANAYTEDEEKSLSEIIQSFNERHGTHFSCEDFLRFERVTRDIMDEDMTEMVRNNPADVVYTAFSQAFFQGMVKMFQQDNEMRNIVMTDKDAREQATRHFFKRAQRQAQG
jgi:type I restriction enzyme R subunit